MCRNIKTLFNFDPPASHEEIRAASIQFVRKLSGSTKPSKANEPAFEEAVDEVSTAAEKLLASLVTSAPPKNREVEAQKARERAAARFGRLVVNQSALLLTFSTLVAVHGLATAESSLGQLHEWFGDCPRDNIALTVLAGDKPVYSVTAPMCTSTKNSNPLWVGPRSSFVPDHDISWTEGATSKTSPAGTAIQVSAYTKRRQLIVVSFNDGRLAHARHKVDFSTESRTDLNSTIAIVSKPVERAPTLIRFSEGGGMGRRDRDIFLFQDGHLLVEEPRASGFMTTRSTKQTHLNDKQVSELMELARNAVTDAETCPPEGVPEPGDMGRETLAVRQDGSYLKRVCASLGGSAAEMLFSKIREALQ